MFRNIAITYLFISAWDLLEIYWKANGKNELPVVNRRPSVYSAAKKTAFNMIFAQSNTFFCETSAKYCFQLE